jgi:D-psicose/D-tagatose/L-ribulose 3-epimerase
MFLFCNKHRRILIIICYRSILDTSVGRAILGRDGSVLITSLERRSVGTIPGKGATMRFGLNTFVLESPFTTASARFLPLIRKMGFDAVEIAYENKGNFDPQEMRKKIEDNGLVCSSVCGAYGDGRDLRGSAAEQKGGLEYIRDCVDVCRQLGASVFCGPHYSRVGRTAMETPEARKEQWDTVVRNLREAGKYAADQGIALAVEPLNRFESDFLNLTSDALRLIADVGSPALKVHVDTFHMNIEEKSMARAVIESGPLLYHVHASENDRGAPGTGLIDWKSLKDALVSIGYDHFVVMESFTPEVEIIAKAASIFRTTEVSTEALCKKGFDFLKALFAK